VTEISTDRVLGAICDNLAVTCPNECGWKGNLGDYESHWQLCALGNEPTEDPALSRAAEPEPKSPNLSSEASFLRDAEDVSRSPAFSTSPLQQLASPVGDTAAAAGSGSLVRPSRIATSIALSSLGQGEAHPSLGVTPTAMSSSEERIESPGGSLSQDNDREDRRLRRIERTRARDARTRGGRGNLSQGMRKHGIRKVLVSLFFLGAVYFGRWIDLKEEDTPAALGGLIGGGGGTSSGGGDYSHGRMGEEEGQGMDCSLALRDLTDRQALCRQGLKELSYMSRNVKGRYPLTVDPSCYTNGRCSSTATTSSVYETVSGAIASAHDDDTVIVGCGSYSEASPLQIRKRIHLVGNPNCEKRPVIDAFSSPVLVYSAEQGTISGLSFRQSGGHCTEGYPCSKTGKAHPALDVRGGNLVLKDCLITSLHGGGVRISGGSPTLMHNTIRETGSYGILFTGGAGGIAYANTVVGSRHVGVQVQEGSTPYIYKNNVTRGVESGVVVCSAGRGLLEDNTISHNGFSGVEIDTSAAPHVTQNRMVSNGQAGVFVHSGGSGYIEENDIQGSKLAGLELGDASEPYVQSNLVRGSEGPGILIQSGAGGVVKNNRLLMGGGNGAVVSRDGSKTRVTENFVGDAGHSGLEEEAAGGAVGASYGDGRVPGML